MTDFSAAERGSTETTAKEQQHNIETIGHATQREDHKQTKWQAIRANPRVFFWCFLPIFCMIVSHFDFQVTGMVLSIPTFRKDFGHPYNGNYVLNAKWQSALGGAPEATAIIASGVGALLSDKFGRRLPIGLALALTYLSAGLEFASTSMPLFFVGKLITGVVYGFFATNVLTFLTEIAPLSLRGVLLGAASAANGMGSLIAYVIGESYAGRADRWSYRGLMCAQWAIGFVPLIAIFLIPESPWWLMSKGREEDAMASLRKLGYTELDAEKRMAVMKVTQQQAAQESLGASWVECFKGTNLRRTMITIGPFTVQALSGVSFISSYLAYYIELAGYSTHKTFQLSCAGQALSISGNIAAFFFVDRVGRRNFTLITFGWLTCLLIICGGLGTRTDSPSFVTGTISLMLMFNFVYNFALGSVAYAIISEAPTNRLRIKSIAISLSIGQALSTMWSFVLPYIFNPDKGNLGARTTFIFGGLSVLCWLFYFFCLPETANRTFEEIDEMFIKKVPARKWKGFKTDAERKEDMATAELQGNDPAVELVNEFSGEK